MLNLTFLGILCLTSPQAESTPEPVVQEAYLKASNSGAADQFGSAVAVDGDTLVVGSIWEDSAANSVNGDQADTSANSAGAAYVFVRDASLWVQQAYLKGSGTEALSLFGGSVAISGDTIAVGAHGEASSGAVYVFVRDGSTWSQEARIPAPSGATFDDRFGLSVALSGDTLVVGAPREDSSATGVDGDQLNNGSLNSGAAFVFVRNDTNWNQQAYLKASNADANDHFGEHVAIFGGTIVVGATDEASASSGVDSSGDDDSLPFSGAAYVFERTGGVWAQEAYLKASNPGELDAFGGAVDVGAGTVVVGAFGESSAATGVDGNQLDDSANVAGAAYVFTRAGSTWSQEAYLKASNTDLGDRFGSSVALADNTLLVGAPNERSDADSPEGDEASNSAILAGAAYLFRCSEGSWSQATYLKSFNSDQLDSFGSTVALDGDQAVVGAAGEASSAVGVDGDASDNSASTAGAAYVFTGIDSGGPSSGFWIEVPGCFGNLASLIAPPQPPNLGGSVDLGIQGSQVQSGLALTFFGNAGVDLAGCGLFLFGLGEGLLSLAPSPSTLPLVSVNQGSASLPISIPTDLELLGVSVTLQAYLIDPLALTAELTSGLTATIGR